MSAMGQLAQLLQCWQTLSQRLKESLFDVYERSSRVPWIVSEFAEVSQHILKRNWLCPVLQNHFHFKCDASKQPLWASSTVGMQEQIRDISLIYIQPKICGKALSSQIAHTAQCALCCRGHINPFLTWAQCVLDPAWVLPSPAPSSDGRRLCFHQRLAGLLFASRHKTEANLWRRKHKNCKIRWIALQGKPPKKATMTKNWISATCKNRTRTSAKVTAQKW